MLRQEGNGLMVVLMLGCMEKLRRIAQKSKVHTSKWLKRADNSPGLKSVVLKSSNPSTQGNAQVAGLRRKQECAVV